MVDDGGRSLLGCKITLPLAMQCSKLPSEEKIVFGNSANLKILIVSFM